MKRSSRLNIFFSVFLLAVLSASLGKGMLFCLLFLLSILSFFLFQGRREISLLFKKTELFFLLLLFGSLSFGVWWGKLALVSPDSLHIGAFATEEGVSGIATGVLHHLPDRRFSQEKWVLSTRSWKPEGGDKMFLSGKILLRVERGSSLTVGDVLSVRGKLTLPFESDEFSYRGFLAKEGIYSLISFPQITKQGFDSHPLFTPLFALRKYFDSALLRFISLPESAFSAGILIGDRGHFSPEQEEEFRRTGLSHILALSGYNISIIALFIFWTFGFLPKKWRIFFTIGSIFFFVLFVGGGSSVVRAAVMGSIGLFAFHAGRVSNGLTLLLLASSLMVLWNPLLPAFDPSFQLSFFGVFGILAFAPFLQGFFLRFFPQMVAEIMSATLAAQIAVFPLITLLFGEISLIAPLANLVIVPLIPLAMLLSFSVVVFASFSPFFATIAGLLASTLLAFCLWIIHFFSLLPFASLSLSLGTIGFFLLLGLVLSWAWSLHFFSKKQNSKKSY